jgi:hypothetical protein
MSLILVAYVDRTVSGCRSNCECTEGVVTKLTRGYPTSVLVSGGLTTLRYEEIGYDFTNVIPTDVVRHSVLLRAVTGCSLPKVSRPCSGLILRDYCFDL